MKVLGLMGSPRKGGNTDVLMDAALDAAKAKGAEVEKVFLNDLKIRPCQACYACRKKGRCVIQDDMQPLYDKLLAADCLLLGSPVYWWTISAQLKLCVDRWFGLFEADYTSKLKGKSAAIISVCQDPDTKPMTDPIIHMFKEAFEFIGVNLLGSVVATADAQGEVAKNPKAMAEARKLGEKIAAA